MRPSDREANSVDNLSFTIHLFREGDSYVAYVPDLDLSSCGETLEKARANIRDAVRGFLEVSEDKGTLGEILAEAGYQQENGGKWQGPEFVSLDRLTMSL